jgi:hypothetical protein
MRLCCGWGLSALLLSGCTAIFGAPRSDDGGAPVDLAGVDLPSVDLAGVDLEGVDLANGGGLLTGAGAPATGNVDLTAAGTADWAHWALTAATDFDHKATGGGQIGNQQVIGFSPLRQLTTAAVTFSWSDGTPHATATATPTGVQVLGQGNGFHFNVPADETTRTLKVWLAGDRSQGKLTAHLSDGSAPDYVDTQFKDQFATYAGVYTLTYHAATNGQALTITWIDLVDYGGGGPNAGGVSLLSATFK